MCRDTALRRIRDSLSIKLRGSPHTGEVLGLSKRLVPGMGEAVKPKQGKLCLARLAARHDRIKNSESSGTGLDHNRRPGTHRLGVGLTAAGRAIACSNHSRL